MHSISRRRVAVITAMGLAAPGALDPESFGKSLGVVELQSKQSAAWIPPNRDVPLAGKCHPLTFPCFQQNLGLSALRGTRSSSSGQQGRSKMMSMR